MTCSEIQDARRKLKEEDDLKKQRLRAQKTAQVEKLKSTASAAPKQNFVITRKSESNVQVRKSYLVTAFHYNINNRTEIMNYLVLYYAIISYVTLYYTRLCFFALRYVRNVTLCCIAWCCIAFRYVTVHYVTLCYATLCCVHVTLRYVMLR